VSFVERQLILYDFDGTIVDTAPLVAEILNQMRIKSGLHPLRVDFYYPWISIGGEKLVAFALGLTANQEIAERLTDFRNIYAKKKTCKSLIFNNIQPVLFALRNKNIYLAIVSNKPSELLKRAINDLEIEQYFQLIIGADCGFAKKPDPSGLLGGIDFFGIPPAGALYVGDSRIDQTAAANAGIDFVYFTSGYDDGVDATQVKYYISQHADILKIIEDRSNCHE
jgi:phosphoglycolate phosphatase